MSTFRMIKQQDQNRGCIPACAASVLRHIGISKIPDWSETDILAMYARPPSSPPPTGFDLLKQFLDTLPEMRCCETVIRHDSEPGVIKNLIASVVSMHGPALIPIKGSPVHCVVIIQPDEHGATICDPSATEPDQQQMTWAEIEDRWIGGLLYFQKNSAK